LADRRDVKWKKRRIWQLDVDGMPDKRQGNRVLLAAMGRIGGDMIIETQNRSPELFSVHWNRMEDVLTARSGLPLVSCFDRRQSG
jgi:hypothetical protein